MSQDAESGNSPDITSQDKNQIAKATDLRPPPYSPRQNIRLSGGYIRLILLKDPMAKEYSLRPTSRLRNLRMPYTIPWHAELAIKVRHMPTLMKDGIFWSGDNISIEKNHILGTRSQFDKFAKSLGWAVGRRYYLRDIKNANIQWAGILTVYAHVYQELQQFKVEELTVDNILFGGAKNGKGQNVYQFDRQRSSENFNAIYGEMPLPGWWPWPKE